MTLRSKVLISLATLVGLAMFAASSRAANDLLAPLSSHVYRQRSFVMGTSRRITHYRGMDLQGALRVLRPRLVARGYVDKSLDVARFHKAVFIKGSMSAPLGSMVIVDGRNVNLDGVVVFDNHQATALESFESRFSTSIGFPSPFVKESDIDLAAIRQFLGE